MKFNHILIAPTIANKSNPITNKYKLLLDEFNKYPKITKLTYSFFPLKLIFKKLSFFLVRESVSLYPFLILLTVFKVKYILEINGNPVFDSNLPTRLKKLIFFIRKNIINANNNCYVYAYSIDEIKFINKNKKQVVIGYNFLNRLPTQATLPRTKNILMLIGRQSDWHGLDKLEPIASYFQDYQFFVFGVSKKKSKNQNIHYCQFKDLDEILATRDYGYAIGSLNYDAKFGKIKTNSSLKGVLYHFLDLPFIQSFKENGGEENFSLLINKINKKNIQRIENFFKYWNTKNIDKKNIEKFSPKYNYEKMISLFNS